MHRFGKACIVVLVGVLLSGCSSFGLKAKRRHEAQLREHLYRMRAAIDQYSADKLRAPQSVQELVAAGYLREIPTDPFTRRNDTWVVVKEDAALAVDQNQRGISDVHSASDGVGTDGKPYSTW